MRVLITGANGLLGQNLFRVLSTEYKLMLTDLQDKALVGDVNGHVYLQADLTEINQVQTLVDQAEPDVIIHCAAMTDVDGCEDQPELAEKVNVGATQNLCAACPQGCRVVAISTDYIFDGEKGPYTEEDKPSPVSVYGKTKLRAETVVQSELDEWLILRTMVLYGTGKGLRPFFTDWVLSKLKAKEPIKVVDDQVGNTTLASNLAGICKCVMEGVEGNGIYHAAGSESISRYEFARRIAECFGYEPKVVDRCKTNDIKQKAPRPLQSGFALDKIALVPGVELLDVRQQLERYRMEREGNGNR